ncbi:MAG: hypothetical protein WD825_00520 [Gemmatimonadaceae bacterium]
MSPQSAKRLVQLFERELRDFDLDAPDASESRKPKRRVSRELDQQVVEFAEQVRTSGSTPEQMLVELKTLLSSVAPEVSVSQRSALVSTVTGRAIIAYFDGTSPKETK